MTIQRANLEFKLKRKVHPEPIRIIVLMLQPMRLQTNITDKKSNRQIESPLNWSHNQKL